MKKLIVRDKIHGRRTKINAKTTYQEDGEWVAEVDKKEMRNACFDLYRGLKECTGEDVHVQADQDDDGKEYKILKS